MIDHSISCCCRTHRHDLLSLIDSSWIQTLTTFVDALPTIWLLTITLHITHQQVSDAGKPCPDDLYLAPSTCGAGGGDVFCGRLVSGGIGHPAMHAFSVCDTERSSGIEERPEDD